MSWIRLRKNTFKHHGSKSKLYLRTYLLLGKNVYLRMPGHFGTNLGYTIPYDVFHFSFLNISIPKHYGTIEKCFQSHFETEFGHEKIDFMFFVCRDIMVAQEGLMTYLLSGERYFQSAFLGYVISISPIVEISVQDFIPS